MVILIDLSILTHETTAMTMTGQVVIIIKHLDYKLLREDKMQHNLHDKFPSSTSV